jgi:hypothetical protein
VAELLLQDGQCGQGWRSRGFGSKETSPVVVVRRRVVLPLTFRARVRLFSKE